MDLDLQTLQFLIGPTMLDKLTSKQKSCANKELGFYKKRVYGATKKILLKDTKDIPNDVLLAFNNYTKLLIQHFKVIDTTDILQEEFKSMDFSKQETEMDELNENIENEANTIIMNNNKEQKSATLHNYVKTIHCETKMDFILPNKKEINIKQQRFRNKK